MEPSSLPPPATRHWLVPDWRSSWRWFSTHVATAFSLLVGWFVANPYELPQLLNYLTPEARRFIPAAVSIGLLAVSLAARLWKQRQKEPARKEP